MPQKDIRRLYLVEVAIHLFGKVFDKDETQCMIMLTHALSSLRKLKITIRNDQLVGELDEDEVEQDICVNEPSEFHVEK